MPTNQEEMLFVLKVKDDGTSEVQRFGGGLDGLSNKVKSTNREFGTWNTSISKTGSHFSALKVTIAGFIASVSFGKIMSETKSFETALVDMGKVTDESFSSIKTKIMGMPSILGSSTDLMKGYYQTISAGVTDSTQAMELLTIASKGSKAAHVEQGQTIEALTKLMTGFSGEIKSAAEASDLLFTIEAKGQTTFAQLVPIIGEVAAVSNLAGVSANEMGAALSAITQTAGSTSQAATQYSAIVRGMLKPQENMKKVLEELNIENVKYEIQQRGLGNVLKDVAKKGGELGFSLGQIFESSEALVGLGPQVQSNFQKWNQYISDMEGKAGATNKAFKDWSTTLEAVQQTFQNTIGKFMIEIGSEMAPSVISALETVTTWLENNKDTLLAIFKAPLEDAKSLATAIGEVTSSLTGLGISIKPLYEMAGGERSISYGIIGTLLWGLKGGAAAVLLTTLNKQLKTLGLDIGSLAEDYDDLGKSIGNIFDVLSGKRSAGTGAPITKGIIDKDEIRYITDSMLGDVENAATKLADSFKVVNKEVTNVGTSVKNLTEKDLKELAKEENEIDKIIKQLIKDAEEMGYMFEQSHWDAQEAAEKHKQALRDLYTEGMQGELDALMELQEEVDKGIEQSVKSLTEKNLQEFEHFLDRIQDLAVDVFETLTDRNINSWTDMVDSMADIWTKFTREIAAQKIRQIIEIEVKKTGSGSTASSTTGGGFDLFGSIGSLFGSGDTGSGGMFDFSSTGSTGSTGGTSMGSSGGMSVLSGIMSGWNTYRSDLYSNNELAGLNSAISSFFANYYGGPIMGMINDTIVMPLMNGLLFGEGSRQKLELGAGSQVQLGRPNVTTPFGLLGIDQAKMIDTDQFKPVMDSIKVVTEMMASVMSDEMIASVTDAMSNWSSDKVRGEISQDDVEGLFKSYFQAIGETWGTEFGQWIADFDGSLGDLINSIQNHVMTIQTVQQAVDSVLEDPLTAEQAINLYWDNMKQSLIDVKYEGELLTQIDEARNKNLMDLADSEQLLAEAEVKRIAREEELINLQERQAQLSHMQWQMGLGNTQQGIGMVAQHIASRYGESLNAQSAQGVLDWARTASRAEIRAIAEHYGLEYDEVVTDINLISSALSDYNSLLEDSTQLTYDYSRGLSEVNRETEQLISTYLRSVEGIDSLIWRLTGGDLAPVQSAEGFLNQYSSLLSAAQSDPSQFSALSSFVPELLKFFQGYGPNYANVTGGVVSDLENLRQAYVNEINREITVNITLQLDGREVARIVARQIVAGENELIRAIRGVQ